jgi:hypothetical protein
VIWARRRILREKRSRMSTVAAALYEIVVKGELGPTVACAFDGMRLECHAGQTAIVGHVEDQAQLNGLLRRVADLGLHLVRVEQLPEDSSSLA